jgi:hypothetical protein
MKKGQVANFHGTLHDSYSMQWRKVRSGFKVLSMKINYLAPFKHKYKHQKFAHEN